MLKWLLPKLNIPKATASRAKIIHKRIWEGPPQAGLWVAPKLLKPMYYITFAYMLDNNWTETDFKVPGKVYDSYHAGDEGILKHYHTEFRNFEKFENK